MATPLKDSFDAGVVAQIADGLPVAKDAFVAECLDGFDRLELKARGVRVAQVMHTHLHRDPATAIGQVASAIGPPLGFGYFAHSEFIGTYGLSAFEESMVAQHALTQVFTAEFCIRPFIAHDPRTMGRLYQWARDDSEHVRRLVSEGTRPRLPWAARLPQFQADPGPVLDLLDLLKDDPSEYVLRSVGNNLNDISRDNPQAALAVAADWLPQRGRLVRRGLRTLLKAGHPQALALLGYQDTDVVASAHLPARLQVGERLPIVVTLQGDGAVLLDLRVHYVKANGATSAKVFRGGEVTVQGKAHVRRTVSFAHHSTRRQYPGPHLIEALVNGVPHELAVVEVVP